MIDFADLGWRDAVLVAAVFIGVYLVLMVARLFQMSSRPGARKREPATAELPAITPEFAHELQRSNIELEVHQLRREMQDLREQQAALHDELQRMKTASHVSPLYSEAMAQAQRGIAADGIAERCGISLAEAELVVAMARGQAQNTRHEHSEERDGQRNRY